MKPFIRLFSLILLLALSGTLRAADPFTFDAPKDWRPERIPFPLGFARELKYQGFEELRFGPGMFRPGAETYWTYVFFWWLEGDVPITRTSLEKDLLTYYRGLSKAVGRGRNLKIQPEKITATLQAVAAPEPDASRFAPLFTGSLRTYDAFQTGRLLDLNLEVSRHHFAGADRTWIFFSVSPHARNSKNWLPLRRIRDSFKLR